MSYIVYVVKPHIYSLWYVTGEDPTDHGVRNPSFGRRTRE